jgi:hypothetical protein
VFPFGSGSKRSSKAIGLFSSSVLVAEEESVGTFSSADSDASLYLSRARTSECSNKLWSYSLRRRKLAIATGGPDDAVGFARARGVSYYGEAFSEFSDHRACHEVLDGKPVSACDLTAVRGQRFKRKAGR